MKKRNPHWLEGTGRRFSVQAAPGFRSDREKDDALSLAWTGGIEHETPAEAARRRRAEKRAKKAARVARLVKAAKARPKSLATRARELGGIAWSSWGDPATRTYPGETGKGWRAAAPGVFRGRPPRLQRSGYDAGMAWDHLAAALRSEGYGPSSAEIGEGSGDSMWLVEVLDAQEAGSTYSREGQEQMAITENAKRARAQQKDEAKQLRRANPAQLSPKFVAALAAYAKQHGGKLPRDDAQFLAWLSKRGRRSNPLLLTLTNPSKTATRAEALAAFRKFHETDPKDVTRLPGDGPPLICLGDLVEIVYRPTRGARRGPAFVHKFGAGARVAATVDGAHLVLLPNPRRPFRVDWSKGIVG